MTLVYLLKQNWLSFFRKLDRETNRPNVVSAYWEILVQVTKRKEAFLSDLVTLSGKKQLNRVINLPIVWSPFSREQQAKDRIMEEATRNRYPKTSNL